MCVFYDATLRLVPSVSKRSVFKVFAECAENSDMADPSALSQGEVYEDLCSGTEGELGKAAPRCGSARECFVESAMRGSVVEPELAGNQRQCVGGGC